MSEPTPSPRRFLSGCLFSALVLACFVVGLVAVLAALGGGVGEGQLEEEHHSGAAEGDAVALVEVSGVIVRGEGRDGGVTTPLLKMIERASEDARVKALMIRLNTPGGSVTDSDLIYHALERLKNAGKPVVLLMDETCASGGYYVSLAATEVWALPTTITGSVGVIMSGLNFSRLLSRHGVEDVTITSGGNKALLSPTRPIDPAHEALLQGVVSELYERFLSLVVKARGLDDPTARALADGRVFTAQQALEAKLIDKIGYPEEALSRLKELAKLPAGARVVHYKAPSSVWSLLGSHLEGGTLEERAARAALSLSASPRQPLYLYAPQGVSYLLLRGLR